MDDPYVFDFDLLKDPLYNTYYYTFFCRHHLEGDKSNIWRNDEAGLDVSFLKKYH